MKIVTKPTSSPSRPEKPPPPLMLKFLRTNTVTRSRARSRFSPIFIRKRNPSSIDTQSEPSSPKVTCIGQVRSSKKTHSGRNPDRRTKSPAKFTCCCPWVTRNTRFCSRLEKRLRLRSIRPVWGKCQWFSPFGYCRSSQKSNAGSSKMESNRDDEYEEDNEDEGKLESSIEGFDCCSPPPKNALLLTRCRSAPYRSSSLASRFWGSETGENRGGEEPTLEKEPGCRDVIQESRMNRAMDGDLGVLGKFDGLIINGGIKKMEEEEEEEEENEEEEEEERGIGRGWVLTRCKSEPARSGERLTTCL